MLCNIDCGFNWRFDYCDFDVDVSFKYCFYLLMKVKDSAKSENIEIIDFSKFLRILVVCCKASHSHDRVFFVNGFLFRRLYTSSKWLISCSRLHRKKYTDYGWISAGQKATSERCY